MKFFTSKKIWKKIVVILVVLLLFQIIAVKPVHAFDGGVLLEPVMTLFVSIGDAVMAVVQDILMQTNRRRRRNANSD